MDISAGATGKDAGKKSPAVLPPTDAASTCLVTLLFSGMMARMLRRSGTVAIHEEEVVSAVLWAMSPLICVYLFFWNIALSGATGSGAVLLQSAFLPLLAAAAAAAAAAAEKLVTPRAGAALIFLATVYSASVSGRALAERRQRAGTEPTAATAAASAPSYQSRAEGRDERRCRAVVASFSVIGAVVLSTALSFLFWFLPDEGVEVPLGEVGLGFLMLLAGPWLVITGQLLVNGSPLQTDADTLALVMPLVFIGWFLAAVLAGVLYDMIAAVFVIWAGTLGMAGFFGYGLAVEAHYKQLMVIKRYRNFVRE